jgi:hypothetical protein
MFFKFQVVQAFQDGPPPPLTGIDISFKNFGCAVPISDIDITKGIYVQWTGRQFATSEFGSDDTDVIYAPNDTINHILRLQDYSREGYSFDYATDTYEEVIDNSTSWGGLQSDYANNGDLSFQINKYDDTYSAKMIDEICQASWSLMSIDGLGRYKLFSMYSFFSDEISRESINLTNIIDGTLGNIKDRNINDIFCEPFINYDFDEGSQQYLKYIRITNTDKAVYSADYVETNGTLTNKEDLWNAGRALYLYYGIKNTAPSQLTTSKYFSSDASAEKYLESWLQWQGWDSFDEKVKERREISFVVPYEFAIENSLDIGSPIAISVPQYESLGDLKGVLTKINYQLQIKDPKVTCTAFVEVSPISEFGDIIETGDNVDTIVESGDQVDEIIEQGV